MIARISLAVVGLGLALSAAFALSPAHAERLIVSVSNHRVTVTASYNCNPIVGSLFGVSSCNVVGTTTMLITH